MMMMCRRLGLWAVALLLSGGTAWAQSEPQTAEQIARRALDNNLLSTSNARAEVALEVSKGKKVVRTRRILTKLRRQEDETRSFVEFLAPADVAGTRFLSIDRKGEAATQLIFLPAFKKVKRVVGAQRNRSFMGTDFSYADLEGRDVDDATWTRLEDAEIGGQSVYVLEGAAKPSDDSPYGRTVLFVHKTHLVPMQIDFYGRKDSAVMIKQFKVRRLEKKDDRWLAMDSVMSTLKKKSATRLRLVKVDFVSDIADAELSRAALER